LASPKSAKKGDLELSDYVQKVLNLLKVLEYIGGLREKDLPSPQFEPSPWFKLEGLAFGMVQKKICFKKEG
jgi:hypothetical protein